MNHDASIEGVGCCSRFSGSAAWLSMAQHGSAWLAEKILCCLDGEPKDLRTEFFTLFVTMTGIQKKKYRDKLSPSVLKYL